MPAIRIANGDIFDPWRPSRSFQYRDLVDDFEWLGHHLANECRYAGGCKWFYSVAQHSVLASRYVLSHWYRDPGIREAGPEVLRKLKLAALLHDVSESVLKDIPSPYKKTSFGLRYKKTEENLLEWFYEQFGIIEYLNAPEIKTIDKELLDAERHVLFPGSPGESGAYRGNIRVEPWDREYARDEFNRTLRDLVNT